MNYKIVKEKGTVKIEASVKQEKWEEEVNKVYKKTAKKYKIQGFRPGTAPRKMIERFYGPSVFFDDAIDELAGKTYEEALDKNEDIDPVDRPKLTNLVFPDGKEPMKFTLEITVRPEVTLGAYTGMKIDKVAYTVKQSDIDAELESACQKASRIVTITDRAIQNGDTVKLDYSGTVGSVKFEGGTATNQKLVIGSGSFIPGFEEQMIGLNIGDEKDLKVKFPDEYHSEELKGKKAVFAVKVLGIEKREVPELNDEFVKDTTKFETLEEYKNQIKSRLTRELSDLSEGQAKNKLLEQIGENASADIPACMIERELDAMIEELEQRLQMSYGGRLTVDQYFQYMGSTAKKYRDENREEAKKAVKLRLAIQEVVKKEKLKATDAEVDAEIEKMAEARGKEVDEIKAEMKLEDLTRIHNRLINDKLFAFLLKKNEFVEVSENEAEKKKVKKETTSKKPATKAAAVAKTEEPKAKKETAAKASATSKKETAPKTS